MTRNNSLDVVSVVPGPLMLTVVATTPKDVHHLDVTVPPLPSDFSVANGPHLIHVFLGDQEVTDPAQVQAYLQGRAMEYEFGEVAARTRVLIVIRVRFSLRRLPSASYLPRIYTFASEAGSDAGTGEASASVAVVRARRR